MSGRRPVPRPVRERFWAGAPVVPGAESACREKLTTSPDLVGVLVNGTPSVPGHLVRARLTVI